MPLRTSAATLLLSYIALFPWAVHLFIPGTSMLLSDVVLVAMTFCVCAAWLRGDRLRIPFELAWPAMLLLLLAIIGALQAHNSDMRMLIAYPVLFAAAIQLSAGEHRLRRHSWVALTLSSAVAALASIAATLGLLRPTAYDLETTVALAPAFDVPNGVAIFLLGAAAGIGMTMCRQLPVALRVACGIGSILNGVALIAAFSTADFEPLITFLRGDIATFAMFMIVAMIWLVARIASKLWVAALEFDAKELRALATLLLVAAIFVIVVKVEPQPYQAVLLGLFAGAGIPMRTFWPQTRVVRQAAWICLPILALIAYNAVTVDPANTRDPRNYAVAAQRDLAQRDYATFLARMTYVERLSPGESRTHYWRTRAALDQGRLGLAADALAAAGTASSAPTILPPPSSSEIEELLVRLRDRGATLSRQERTFYYERALIAVGHRDAALASLQVQAQQSDQSWGPWPVESLARTVAFSVSGDDDGETFDALKTWPGKDLLALLTRWGAQVGPAPQGFPGESLPLVVLAWDTGVTEYVYVAGGAAYGRAFDVPVSSPARSVGGAAHWGELAQLESAWTIAWLWDNAVEGDSLGRITLRTPTLSDADFLPAERASAPSNVAIRVWLP